MEEKVGNLYVFGTSGITLKENFSNYKEYQKKRGLPMNDKMVKKYIPLTEATYYILLCMTKPIHGYGVMQTVQEITNGKVTLGPGTLYGATTKLLKDGLIIPVESEQGEERRKCYTLTELGRYILKEDFKRLQMLIKAGEEKIKELG